MKDLADIHFAHAKTIILVHRRLGPQWLKLAEKARVAGGRTRYVTSSLRDAAAHTAARSLVPQFPRNFQSRSPGSTLSRVPQHSARYDFLIFLWW
jgi:hypothetical protein